MTTVEPIRVTTPGEPPIPAAPRCAAPRWEWRRWEWRLGDPGDPAERVEAFLTECGLPVGDLTAPAATDHHDTGICGASLYVSATAGARLVGAPAAREPTGSGPPDVVAVVWAHGAVPRRRPADPFRPAGRFRLGPWRDSWTPDAHAAAVAAVREAIARGDVYQVNVVGHASAPYEGDPLPALHRVAALPGARYGGVLCAAAGGVDRWAIGCASPETLVAVADGTVVTRPIKGTRPATLVGRAELLGSRKERAEHVMIVDLARNDLARVARTGSVRVDELYAVRRWCDLWQAESVVSARLAAGVGLAELLRAVCPGGSVTGAPKRAALEHIAAVEPVGRGVSMGALGWVGHGTLDLGLTIRTVAVDGTRVHVWAGGGITWDSDPGAEVAEAAAKAAPLRAALAG